MKHKIIHIAIAAFYKEGYGYQENILPSKHKQLGLDTLIVSFDRYGYYQNKGVKEYPYTYINDRGIRTVILPKNKSFFRRIPIWGTYANRTEGLYHLLCEEKPDIIFVHGAASPDHFDVVKYVKKHPSVALYVDNHNDYYNAPMDNFWAKFFLYTLERPVVKSLSKYAKVLWGVTPWRVDFLINVFGAPKDKVDLLVMGGDENKVHWEDRISIRRDVRNKYNIPSKAFLIVTGGRIDKQKNIDNLISSIESFTGETKPYLLFFGKPQEDMKDYFKKVFPSNIINAGWIESDDVYPLFLSADLVAFPGTHSVLWEQACASGAPCLFKDWEGGFSHVDVGGNCKILCDVSPNNLFKVIKELIDNPNELRKMKDVAENTARPYFSYIEIAKRSIQLQ